MRRVRVKRAETLAHCIVFRFGDVEVLRYAATGPVEGPSWSAFVAGLPSSREVPK